MQRAVIGLGLALWDQASTELQVAAGEALALAMRRNPMETLELAERRGWLEMACPLARGDARLAKTRWPARCERSATRK